MESVTTVTAAAIATLTASIQELRNILADYLQGRSREYEKLVVYGGKNVTISSSPSSPSPPSGNGI